MRNWFVYSVKVGPLGLCLMLPLLHKHVHSFTQTTKGHCKQRVASVFGKMAFCSHFFYFRITYQSLSDPGHMDCNAFDKSIEECVAVICRDEC